MKLLIQSAATASLSLAFITPAYAQMGGGPGNDPAPAFSEPKFTDRVFESGGPRAREAKNGSLILSVKIEGNKTVSENAILAVMQSRQDRVFDTETFQRDIAALYRTGLFKRIEPYFTEEGGGVHMKLVVQERPIIKSVLFTGNQSVEDSALMKHASIAKGEPLDPIAINSARNNLIEYYQDKGMNQVDIQVVSGLQPGERDVEFLINEGPIERFNAIRFTGNKDFSSELLKARISSKDARGGLTKWMFNRASDLKIENDRQTLTAYYRRLGYFDARVDARKEYDSTGKWVDLTFVIYEGVRYKIRSVSISGTKRYQPDELLPYMTAKQGEFFQLDNKSADERFIRDLYGTQGHYFCDVVGEMVYQPNNEVDIIYNVGEGDIYRISDVRVHIEGDFTKERVVLHPLANVRPGSIIDSKGVEDATRRLRFSSIFNNDPSQGIVPTIKVEPPENVDLDK
ncbi:MAG: hypothetical protein MUD03_07785 [Pirellula sp.]|jgi:outer membrane protein insertion porin family|nr:hypothetical protein [Pirellula sp.]